MSIPSARSGGQLALCRQGKLGARNQVVQLRV